MKSLKAIHILLSAALLLTLSTMPCGAGSGKKKLLLFAKNPATWAIVKNGATGKLVYHEASGAFTLQASGLQPRHSYAFIRIDQAVPKAEIISRGMSDDRGRLELAGNWHNWSKKFWVVAGDDVAGKAGEAGTLKAWHPDKYLFEEKPLGIACDCPEAEEP